MDTKEEKSPIFSDLTQLAIHAATQASDLLRKGFGTSFSVESKEGRHNLVTEYDHRAEEQILKTLQAALPDASFLCEESGHIKTDSKFQWIIDPLDGTVNFAHGIPFFAVSIALAVDGEVILGVIALPLRNELFVAEKGKGAYLNQKRIFVSPTPEFLDALLVTGFPYDLDKNPGHCIEHLEDILKTGVPVRYLGSAATQLAFLAAGRIDGYFEIHLAPWDCAAGILLVEEAHGKISQWNGEPLNLYNYEPFVATNTKVHEETVQILKRVPR